MTGPPANVTRLALRPKEVAEALGISERSLRQILPALPHLRVGTSVLIPSRPRQAIERSWRVVPEWVFRSESGGRTNIRNLERIWLRLHSTTSGGDAILKRSAR